MITSAIGGAVTHPLVADLDDDTLRSELFRLSRAMLERTDVNPRGGRTQASGTQPPRPTDRDGAQYRAETGPTGTAPTRSRP